MSDVSALKVSEVSRCQFFSAKLQASQKEQLFTSKKFALVLYFSSWFIFETPGEALRFRKFAAHLPSRQWGYKMNLCAILKVPVFIRRVFFILIRNLDLQKGMCFHYSERNQS